MTISIECDVHIAELQIYNSETEIFFRFIIFADKGKTPEVEYTDRVHENHRLRVTSLRATNRQLRS